MIGPSPLSRPSNKRLATACILLLAPCLAACAVAAAQTTDRQTQENSQEAQPEELTARQKGGRHCFFAWQVNGFRNVEDENGRRVDDRILIDVGASDTFEFEILGRCPGLRFARGIVLDRTGPGRICDGLDVDLIVADDVAPRRCPVTMVRKLEPGEKYARAGAKE